MFWTERAGEDSKATPYCKGQTMNSATGRSFADRPETSANPLEIDLGLFREQFPKRPFLVHHQLANHPLFAIPRLLDLAKSLPESCVEYNEGNIPTNMGNQA